MKRSEMHPGMQVELQRGRDYPSFTANVIVLDTELWTLQRDWSTREERAFPYKQANVGREICRGIPVAVKKAVYQTEPNSSRVVYDDDDNPILLGYEWEPRFVRAQEIVPAGTKAEHDRAYEEARKRDQRVRAERDARIASYKDRLRGLPTGIRLHDHDVTISYTALDALLNEAGR